MDLISLWQCQRELSCIILTESGPQLINHQPSDLWALAAENLRQKDKDSLRELKATTTRIEDVAIAVEERKKECKDRQWELKRNKGKNAIVLRDVFSKVATWMQKLVEVGDVAVSYDPGHAALPWAGIRFLLKVCMFSGLVSQAERT